MQRPVNQKKNYLETAKEEGFTLVEVIVAVAIISFAIFATLRVITASLNSITRQGQRAKALHLAQAHLAKLEAESFPNVVPENFVVPSTQEYQLKSITSNNQIVDKDGSGNASTGDFRLYKGDSTPIPSTTGWSYDSTNLKIINIPTELVDQEIYLEYESYHLVNEGGTIPYSDGQGIKEGIIRIATDAGILSSITVKETDTGNDIDPDSYSSATRELAFKNSDEGKSVWVYYLPQKTTDSDGDGYEDPTDNSILGVVEGSFFDPDEGLVKKITNTKKVTITEYWKQGKNIQSAVQETYILR